jgi:hypothetical protein
LLRRSDGGGLILPDRLPGTFRYCGGVSGVTENTTANPTEVSSDDFDAGMSQNHSQLTILCVDATGEKVPNTDMTGAHPGVRPRAPASPGKGWRRRRNAALRRN